MGIRSRRRKYHVQGMCAPKFKKILLAITLMFTVSRAAGKLGCSQIDVNSLEDKDIHIAFAVKSNVHLFRYPPAPIIRCHTLQEDKDTLEPTLRVAMIKNDSEYLKPVRRHFGISKNSHPKDVDFLKSEFWCNKSKKSNGKSGSKFIPSRDGRFMLKSMNWADVKGFYLIREHYATHIKNGSMLPRILFIFRELQNEKVTNKYWMIMSSWFTPLPEGWIERVSEETGEPEYYHGEKGVTQSDKPKENILGTYDLKGSVYSRHDKDKDINLLREVKGFMVGDEQKVSELDAMIKTDVEFLKLHGLLDYSLLLRRTAPKQCLNYPVAPDEKTEDQESRKSLKELMKTSLRAIPIKVETHLRNGKTKKEVLNFGFIDILQPWDFKKRAEAKYKIGKVNGRDVVVSLTTGTLNPYMAVGACVKGKCDYASACPPDQYAPRFLAFCEILFGASLDCGTVTPFQGCLEKFIKDRNEDYIDTIVKYINKGYNDRNIWPNTYDLKILHASIMIPEIDAKRKNKSIQQGYTLEFRQHSRRCGYRYDWRVGSTCVGFTTGRGHPVYEFTRTRGSDVQRQVFEIKSITILGGNEIRFRLNLCDIRQTGIIYTTKTFETTKTFYARPAALSSVKVTNDQIKRLWERIKHERKDIKRDVKRAAAWNFVHPDIRVRGHRLIERPLREEARIEASTSAGPQK